MENLRLTFSKSQHLCGETTISQLFREGKAFLVFPLRVVYRVMPRNVGTHGSCVRDNRPPVRVLVSVPKKQFKHAVDRNRFKRLIREAYRLQQHELNEALEARGLVMDVAFTAVHNQLPEFDFLKGRMAKILSKLVDSQQSTVNGQ
ncbi:MAG: ribonuclease P protein component [Paludibacteraceae bacterium]|nr:ribonuclease P protein component [Paludibacteraceae bacterium]